ncbi:MAG: helix-turn-helix protein [Solirubrobacterales bacterium]|jgi:transcriptional regulator with XRE-family HTH domain|nr:helix-turn-helix protein [Solirubrobacterales bacterium]
MGRKREYSETVRHAAGLLGAQIRQARIQRDWTVRHLAERAGISKDTLLKVEHGDPSVALGTAFDLAVLVGVPLFFDDRRRLASEAARAQERATLLARRVRPQAVEPDYDF